MKPPSYRFVVTGRVQGVGFRQAASAQADRLRLHGWVRNRDDGAVEGVVSGVDDPIALAAFRQWLDRGPVAARVSGVQWLEAEESPPNTGFQVLR
ncbi:MAG: acylphosphatase [Panacagrimonas sp.]